MMTFSPDTLPFAPGLDVAARSAVGAGSLMRTENQDNFLLIDASGKATYLYHQALREQQVPGWPVGHARAAVLDGMGGHGQGREAAEAVVAGLLSLPACSTLDALSARLDALHARLQQQFGHVGPERRPGTTLTMLEMPPGQAPLLYHVGDSRLYAIGHGRVATLTIDHVPATAYAMAGALDEDEWWRQVHGEHRSQISQAFILGNAFADTGHLSDPLYALTPHNLPPFLHHLADRRPLALEPGLVYLLASDGFWSCEHAAAWLARWPALLDGSAGSAAMCDRLFEALASAPPPGMHPDNLTAIVLQHIGGGETALPSG